MQFVLRDVGLERRRARFPNEAQKQRVPIRLCSRSQNSLLQCDFSSRSSRQLNSNHHEFDSFLFARDPYAISSKWPEVGYTKRSNTRNFLDDRWEKLSGMDIQSGSPNRPARVV